MGLERSAGPGEVGRTFKPLIPSGRTAWIGAWVLAAVVVSSSLAETSVTVGPTIGSVSNSLPVSVHLNGEARHPAPGSAAGVWFYADRSRGIQLLLLGHATVPGSWRWTAVLPAGTEARLVLGSDNAGTATAGFRSESPEYSGVTCRTETNGWVMTAGSSGGVVRVDRLTWGGRPVSLAPVRRPFSRAPVEGSPDLHPAIAESLIEWDWRMQDGIGTPRESRSYRQAIEQVLRRTEAMVAERRRSGNLSREESAAWESVIQCELPAEEAAEGWEARWLEVHRLRRRLVLSNPLFRIPALVFVKHVPSVMSHQLTQVYGYCSRPGGGLFVLETPGTGMRTRDLTPASLPAGNFMTPELSPEADRLLFAYCPVREAPASWDYDERTRHLRYHVHEVSLRSGEVRALTTGDTDNFSPVVLPSGDILYVSTRRGGFHRCGRGPCFVYTLSRMGADGSEPRSLSLHETHEWDPSLLNDGRVIYTRWDYVDRNAVHYQQLWSTFADGGGARIHYGNWTWNPTGLWEARAVPGSTKVMATAGPHHGMSAGSVVLVDTTRGVDGPEPLTRMTPDVRFPESETPLAHGPSPTGYDFDTPPTQYWRSPLEESWAEKSEPEEERRWPGHCYKTPWPLSETYFVVGYSFDRLVGEPGPNLPNQFGIYFADAFGNKELIYRDPAISSLWARPLAGRKPPPEVSMTRLPATDGNGTFLVRNVGEGWPGLPRDLRITGLRILQVMLKTTPHADQPRVGAAFAAPGKQVLGTVPVEEDGSAFFEVPARTPVLFQALDARGRAVQTMRSLVYLQPGEHQSCVGCHEHRLSTAGAGSAALAVRRPPSKIKPGPEGSRPFSFQRLVQPVLDRQCVRCHDGKEPGRSVLTGEPEGAFTKAYNALTGRVSFSAWGRPERNFEPMTEPLRFGAIASPLTQLLDRGHEEVRLTADDEERLTTWMDANALFYGTFDVDEQRKQLAGETIAGPKE